MADITEDCLPGFIEYVIRRSGGRSALRFYGHILAKAQDKFDSVTVRRAVIYETQGGNLVSELCLTQDYGNQFAEKCLAEVFVTLEEAIAWFESGRLKSELVRQLAGPKPEFIK
jgi:hypothetical protein